MRRSSTPPTAQTWTQELRFSGSTGRLRWIGGGFVSHQNRHYSQDLPVTGFEDITGIPTRGLRAPKDSLFWSDLDYTLDQFALFGEATFPLTEAWSVTGGLRYYNFNEDKEQIFDGIFGNDNNGTALVSQPGSTDAQGAAPRFIATYRLSENANLNAQVSRGFRLGGINDPLNVPLCTPQDLVTFGGRETWEDETVWNYEVGMKSRVLNGNGAIGVSGFYMDIHDLQATVTAGSCSSRVIFNVPKARSQGFEVEFEAAPNANIDFAISASVTDAELRSTLTSVDATGAVSIVSGIEEGRRLPSVPNFQLAAAATYQWEVRAASLAYVTGTFQHIGSRYTQVGDEDLGTLDLLSFGSQHDWRPVDGERLHLRPASARLRHPQPASRGPPRELGRLRVSEQRDRRASAAVVRSRARHAGAHRLPDESAAHVRHWDEDELLINSQLPTGREGQLPTPNRTPLPTPI